MASKPPRGTRRPVQASDVLAASATRSTIAKATARLRSGRASAESHCRTGTLAGSGIRDNACARPRINGSRISGSNLCTLRSGVPPSSRKN
ncbi:Uncharacterised protein [Mycobacteroides abscessus subsp. abscessus]|nr:Uncharacterised protein [Mycobacteroides abscessus subsp. abscessus]